MAPLTLLIGENSTGKTSFQAAIRALQDCAWRGGLPDFKREPYDLGGFDEIAHFRSGKGGHADSFEAGFDFTGHDKSNGSDFPVRLKIGFKEVENIPAVGKIRISDQNEVLWAECDFHDKNSAIFRIGTGNGICRWKFDLHQPRISSLPLFILFDAVSILSSERSHSGFFKCYNGPDPTSDDWKKLETILDQFDEPHYGDSSYAGAPVRSRPHRTYDPSNTARDPEGNNIPTYLANIYLHDKSRWGALKSSLENFGRNSGLFDEISVRTLGSGKSGDPFQLRIRRSGNRKKIKGPWRNLVDVGYGVSQALPVIAELLREDAPSVFLLQQPEVHLHPSAQAALGSLFCQIAAPGRQIVVETHSDHLLNRIRLDVRDGAGALRPDDVSILFFEPCELDVRIHSLKLDDMGNILGTPPNYRSFFKAETRRSLGL